MNCEEQYVENRKVVTCHRTAAWEYNNIIRGNFYRCKVHRYVDIRNGNYLEGIVPIIVDNYEPEKCGKCNSLIPASWGTQEIDDYFTLFRLFTHIGHRCNQCLEEAK